MADNIEQLIETVQEQGIDTNEILRQSIDFEDLQLEALFEIKDVLIDTQLSFMEYFASEQERFNQQQLDLRDKELADIERNRELKDTLAGLPVEQAKVSEDKTQQDESGSSFAAGLVGGGIGGGLARGAGAVAKRFLPLAAILGAGATGLRFLENLDETGSAMEATGETAGDIYDFAFLPALNAGLELMADELGYNNEELANARQALINFRGTVESSAENLFRDVKEFFGDLSAEEAVAESASRVAELREQESELASQVTLTPEQIARTEQRLGEISQELEQEDLSRSARQRLITEQRALTAQYEPVEALNQLRDQIQQEERAGILAQRGFESPDVQSQGQMEFESLPSTQKEAFFESKVDPLLIQAIDSGALKRNNLTEFLNFQPFGGFDHYTIPLEIDSLDALEDLSKQQLEAILINDDVLRRSPSQAGALDSRDRQIVEYLYQAADLQPVEVTAQSVRALPSSQISPTAANLADTPNMIEAGLQPQMAPVPTARNFDVSLNALLNAPIGRASQEVNNSNMSPVIISAPTRGGDTVNNTVNNSQNTFVGGGASARSNQPSYLRTQDRLQGSN